MFSFANKSVLCPVFSVLLSTDSDNSNNRRVRLAFPTYNQNALSMNVTSFLAPNSSTWNIDF